MQRIVAVALATVLSACGGDSSKAQNPTADFVFRDGTGFIATVTMPDPLPLHNFPFRYRSQDGSREPQSGPDGAFEHAREGAADCYFARGMPTICNRVPGTDAPMPERLSDGSMIEGERKRGDVIRYVLDDRSFADFQGGLLLRFGILREDGVPDFSYDRVKQ